MPNNDRLHHEEYMDSTSYYDDYTTNSNFNKDYPYGEELERLQVGLNRSIINIMYKHLNQYRYGLDKDKRHYLDVFFPDATSEEKNVAILKSNAWKNFKSF